MKTVGIKAQPCAAAAVMERCRAAGWTLEPEQAEKLAAYLDLLMQWNRAMNLVGTHSWIETLERLVFDSFELARFLNHKVLLERTESALERFAVENGNCSGGRGSGRPRRMSLKTTLFRRNDGSAAFEMGQFQKQNALGQGSEAAFPICWDLGAGAGLPGVPLRILWERGEYWLVEAREKRALFLSTALARIPLPGTRVFRGRTETFMPGRQADLVLSRAFMPWREVLGLVRDHLAPGGRVILLTREVINAGELNAGTLKTDWRMTASEAYQVGPDTRRLYALAADPA